jgi:hypothetical protein
MFGMERRGHETLDEDIGPNSTAGFAWNHNVVMGWGEEDIRSRLAAAG